MKKSYVKVEIYVPESIYNWFVKHLENRKIENFITVENKIKWLFSAFLYEKLEHYHKHMQGLKGKYVVFREC